MPLTFTSLRGAVSIRGALNPAQSAGPLESSADGGWLVGGRSSSTNSGNKTAPLIGSYDFWLVKTRPEPVLLSNASMSSTGFTFRVSGLAFRGNVVVQASSNRVDWAAMRTNAPVTGSLIFTDPAPPSPGPRFYRVRED